MYLKSFTLNSVSLFENVTVPVETNNGLVVIAGMNLDSDEPNNTNGAGKSLLMGSLSIPLFERSPVTDLKTKTKDKKDLLKKGSDIQLNFVGVNGKEYEYKQTSSSYSVIENGKDLKVAKQEVAKKYLKTAVPMSEEEFYSVCYIQNTKPLQFQHCTDAQRLHFITELFDLQIFDHIRAEINKERGRIKDAGIEYETLSGQLDTAQRQAEKLEPKLLSEDEEAELSSKRKQLKKKEKALLREIQKLEKQAEDANEIKELQASEKKLKTKLPKKLSHDQIKDEIRLTEQYQEYSERLDLYKKRSDKFTRIISEISSELKGKTFSTKRLKEEIADLAASILDMEEQGERYAEYHNTVEETQKSIKLLEKRLAKYNFDPKKVTLDSLDIDVDFCRSAVKLYRTLSEKAGDGQCPTCGSDVDLKVIKKGAKKASEKLNYYYEVEEAEKVYEEIKSLKKELKQIKSEGEPKFDPKKLKAAEKELKKLERCLALTERLIDYNSKLELIDKPKKVKKPSTKYSLEELYDFYKVSKKLKEVQLLLQANNGSDVDLKKVDSKIAEKEKELSKLSGKLETVESSLTEHKVNLREFEVHSKNVKRINKKLSSSKKVFDRKKLFDYLFKKYGNTDMKLQAASAILKLLETNLNTFSSLVFVEPVEFKVVPTTGGIGAYYRMKGEDWVNISRLSGAETNCFRLLFAVSLLPLIPEERRTNFIIVDEPDAACSEVVRQRMIKDFLPKLRSLVPNVFWVTPKETDSFKEAEVWRVVKEGGKSRVEGIVND